ncbi:MAG: hypothetical protein OXB95_06770 [Rhodobacteraceae bacterium]|nr:hypothetical protein [Paracoccaceae bacterium]
MGLVSLFSELRQIETIVKRSPRVSWHMGLFVPAAVARLGEDVR